MPSGSRAEVGKSKREREEEGTSVNWLLLIVVVVCVAHTALVAVVVGGAKSPKTTTVHFPRWGSFISIPLSLSLDAIPVRQKEKSE